MIKTISHAERMSAPAVHYRKSLSEPMVINAAEDVVENNRIVKKSVLKTIDPREMNRGVKVSDFFMENVIAVGALDSLKQGQVSGSTLENADNLDAQIPALDAFISENSAQNEPVNE